MGKMVPMELTDFPEKMELREKWEPRVKPELQATTETKDQLAREESQDKRVLPELRDRKDSKVRTELKDNLDLKVYASLMTIILATVTPIPLSDIPRLLMHQTVQLSTNPSGPATHLSSSRAMDMDFLKISEALVPAWKNSN